MANPEYPPAPPAPPGRTPPMGWGPRPQPWEAPGTPQAPPPFRPYYSAPPAAPPRARVPGWAWAVIGTLVVLFAASLVWVADLTSERNDLRRVASRPAPTTPGTTSPATAPSTTAPATIEAGIDQLKDATEKVRGLEFRSELQVDILDNDSLAERVRQVIKDEYDPVRVDVEGRRLGLLGLIPPAIASRYYSYVSDLLAEQVAGFYDPKTRELVVGAPSGELDGFTKITTVHELTHGLTDQHFNFGPPTDELFKEGLDDELAAYLAVIEGDATLAMTQYAFTIGPELLDSGPLPETPLFDAAPTYVRDTFLFPYQEGLAFVEDHYDQGGWKAVDRLYQRPPTTTEQVLHPEKYESGEGAKPVDLPDLDLGPGWQQTAAMSFGQFVIQEILEDALLADEAERGATGWGGDRYAQYEKDGALLLAIRIVADDPAAAAASQEAWGKFLEKWGNSGRGSSRLALRGDVVTVILSTDNDAVAKAADLLLA